MKAVKKISNSTLEEVRKGFEQKKREEKCPVCGGIRKREDFMRNVEGNLLRFIRENNLAKRESCLFCVKKHVGKALVLYKELLSADPDQEGKGRVNTFLNHLEILGNLQAAADEAAEYPKLYSLLLESERVYRYEGLPPHWEKIAILTAECEGENI